MPDVSLTNDEESRPKKSTASGLLRRGNDVLLERRPSEARVSADQWDTPGGHLEPGESPEACLVRELDEELGVVPTSFRLWTVYDERDHTSGELYRHFVFEVTAWRGEIQTKEGQEVSWHSIETLTHLDRFNPALRDAIGQLTDVRD